MNFKLLVSLTLLCARSHSLSAQAPILQDHAEALRQEEIRWAEPAWALDHSAEPEPSWRLREVALVSITKPGSEWTPLNGGMGLGTVLYGNGMALDVGGQANGWKANAHLLFLDDGAGHRVGRLHSGVLSYQRPSGWRFALDNGPIKWGYGPLGGHLLGTSSNPFPKFRFNTRDYLPSLAQQGLGRWNLEFFAGQLETRRRVPAWQAGYSALADAARTRGGDFGRPYLSGWRISGEMAERVQIHLGVTSMWGGLRSDGSSRMSGLSWKNYFMGAIGGENTLLAEADNNTVTDTQYYRNLSNGIAAFDVRARNDWIAEKLGASGAYWYYERSGENINWQWKPFLKNPLKAIVYDLEHVRAALGNGDPASVPSFSAQTDALGLQVNWPTLQLGVEIRDAQTEMDSPWGYQTYQSGNFLAGNSREGDSLGILFGGSYVTGSISLDWQPDPATQIHALITRGARRFTDDPAVWAKDHPDSGSPQQNIIYYFETSLQRRFGQGWRAGGTLGVKRDMHVAYTEENRTGFTLILSLGKSL